MSLSQTALMPQKRYMGLTQIDLIIQIYYFLLRFPRFLRETINPLADGADAAERYMGLTQIDLIIQILLFPLRVLRFPRETTNPLADGADDAERYMGLTQIDLIKQILLFSSAVSAISARNYQSSRRLRRKSL